MTRSVAMFHLDGGHRQHAEPSDDGIDVQLNSVLLRGGCWPTTNRRDQRAPLSGESGS